MIPIIKPDISFDEVAEDFRAILESGHLTRGRYVEGFERGIADFVGAPFAVATTSATTALHLALVAAGIGPGDQVLVSDFTYPASGNAIAQTGAVPGLVDCLPGRFDLDPADAAAKVTDRTRAIMVVHPFGQPADMPAIAALAREHDLVVVEDAACALGTSVGGINAGAWGDFGCFSFHPRKILTTGEGGMVTAKDAGFVEKLRLLHSHGAERTESGFSFVAHGYNYRMSEIQAAMGLAQLRRFADILADRRRTAVAYLERLAGIGDVSVPLSGGVDQCTFQSFVVMLAPGISRELVSQHMRQAGVETTLGTYAMHAHPVFARLGYVPGDLPQSYQAQAQSLTLPLLPRMTEAHLDIVVRALTDALPRARRG